MSTAKHDEQIAKLFFENQELRGQLAERTAERDRARATAVALEQQIAQIEHEMRDLQARYERRDESEFSGESSAALDAVQDCVTTVEAVTDELTGDVFEANQPVPLAQAREGTA